MLPKGEFDLAIRGVTDPATRIETFGALLAKASGVGPRLLITGGSAITIYTHGRFTSEDVDVVGPKKRIIPVLRRWGFQPEEDPSDQRIYWNRDDLGLSIDIIHRSRASGSGRRGNPRTISTAHGPVHASAIEDLVVRRLVFWSRDGKAELMDQAVILFQSNQEEIDLEYLEGEVRWEGVGTAYGELQRLAEL